MNINNYAPEALAIILAAKKLAQTRGHEMVEPEHLARVMLDNEKIQTILRDTAVEIGPLPKTLELALAKIKRVEGAQTVLGQRTLKIGVGAERLATKFDSPKVQLPHLLLGILSIEGDPCTVALNNAGATDGLLREHLFQTVSSNGAKTILGKEGSALKTYTIDLTAKAKAGLLGPIIGRDDETRRVITTLCRTSKNNPILIGQPGVGRTSIIHGLACRIAADDVPPALKGKRVLVLELSSMLAGATLRGQFEERVKNLMAEVKAAGKQVILYVEEVQTMVGKAGEGSNDASSLIKPALSRGEVQIIGSTTNDEYRNSIEKDRSLERRFQPILVEEPSEEQTLQILRGIKGSRFERPHRVLIEDEALVQAIKLSKRYIASKYLPEKAIAILDDAATRLRLTLDSVHPEIDAAVRNLQNLQSEQVIAGEGEAKEILAKKAGLAKKELEEVRAKRQHSGQQKSVSSSDVVDVVAELTGIPISKLDGDEQARLLDMEQQIGKRVIGQEPAVAAVCRAIRRSKSGLNDPNRPLLSLLAIGTSGCGKTELAKTLADTLFNDPNAMVRLDMSEYQDKASVSRLIGSPPGYVGSQDGGQLTEPIRLRPYQIVLGDEAEKCSQDIWNVFLQILDDGRLSDSQGRLVDFKNTVVILTSNIGGRHLLKSAEEYGCITTEAKELVEKDLKAHFRPEFLGRLDEVIMFNSLTRQNMLAITETQLANVAKLLKAKKLGVHFSNEVKAFLAEKGYQPQFGARPLRRLIQTHVQDKLAVELLKNKFAAGDTVMVELDDNQEVCFKKGAQ